LSARLFALALLGVLPGADSPPRISGWSLGLLRHHQYIMITVAGPICFPLIDSATLLSECFVLLPVKSRRSSFNVC
jgi:hypothetical protein